jgi:hypothetical protein
MEVGLDNRLSDASPDPESGDTIARFSPASPSGIGKLPNRGQEGRSWILEWYNRVRNFSQNHFGRTYTLSNDSSLFQDINKFDIVQEAWCNLENESESNTYQDGYKIKGKFKFLAPFWDESQNKLRAYAILPSSIQWGTDGLGVPAQFDQWNENQDNQWVPIEVKKWDRPQDKFGGGDALIKPLNEAKGVLFKFPNIAIRQFDVDPQASGQKAVQYLVGKFLGQTTFDIKNDPQTIAAPIQAISGNQIGLPIRVDRRYGFQWPDAWTGGNGTKFEVINRNDLAPWNFEPRGNKKSFQLMDEEGQSVVASRIVDRPNVTFGEATKVGLPIISFDEFASQTPEIVNNLPIQGGADRGVYGVTKHGVTNLSITKNLNWWQTRYSVKSHFPQLIKARPVKEITEEDFRFVIKRLETDIPLPPAGFPFEPPSIFDPGTNDAKEQILAADIKETLQIPVTITAVIPQVINFIDDFHYEGKDKRGVIWPAQRRASFQTAPQSVYNKVPDKFALCTDGFLVEGMQAVYYYEDLDDGTFTHYFTGGISLSVSRIVEITSNPVALGDDGFFRSDIRTLEETIFWTDPENGQEKSRILDPFIIKNVPYADQDNVEGNDSLVIGKQILLGGTGTENSNVVRPGSDIANNERAKNRVWLVTNTGSTAGTLSLATVKTVPNAVTGRSGSIETVTGDAGAIWSDGGTTGVGANSRSVTVDFLGIEFGHIQVGDVGLFSRETEQLTDAERAAGQTAGLRFLVFIVKPLFMPTDAFGQSII